MSGLRLTTAHSASHAIPTTPVNQNAPRQPHQRNIGVTTSGVTTAPSDPPLYATAKPRPRRSLGSVCTTVRSPPGKVAPSPKPSAARAAAKLHKPPAKACAIDASVQQETAIVIPRRNPARSRIRPQMGLATAYAIEKAAMIHPYCWPLNPVSRRMVGASNASVLRSI